MLNRPSFIKAFIILALAVTIGVSVSSCGTQKMGCPGSITSNEQPATSAS